MEAGANAKVTAFTINSEPQEVTVICIEPIVYIYADKYSITTTESATITAVVTKTDGTPVEGVIVIFFTKNDIGTLNPVYYLTGINGIATTDLTFASGDVDNSAIITARCGSRVSDPIEIKCVSE